MDNFGNILKHYYNVEMDEIHSQQGGWASLAYKVIDETNCYFLKVYEKHRTSTAKLTALIDQYAPVLIWLEDNSQLKGKIPVPLLTKNGEYKCEDKDYIYLLYAYIEGETIGNQKLTEEQITKLSQMVAELHVYGENIPVPTDSLKEDFEVPFLAPMENLLYMEKSFSANLQELLSMYDQQIKELIKSVEKLSGDLKVMNPKLVLSHSDLHYWNIMQSEQLMIIDWEGLRLAPAEADMMFFVDQPYFHTFLRIYQTFHPNYSINPGALNFYKKKRKLEDIWEFIEQLLYDNPDEQTRNAAINHLKRELNNLGE